ncbi:preprotein translocase subunit SecG [uncultured Mucilaginibacter sp.]|uniref:preprotein translocase subunit SecG n=1 Tax=uncultured Mucilaginibacter sp. TaxID=797541 RepID=UPI0025CEE21E|nr:preprotein translocase subunit SecG [uncultured Mucilaginibacter sp.]
MYFLIVIAIIVCVLLGLIVLIQNPKGGGLSSNFSSSSQLLGVQKTGDILEKGTWILAIALMCLSLLINVVGKGGIAKSDNGSIDNDKVKKISQPASTPNSASPFGGLQQTPAPAPAKKP